MLRNDVKHMIDTDWEPQIPDARIIRNQCKKFPCKSFNNVRLSKGLTVTTFISKASKEENHRRP